MPTPRHNGFTLIELMVVITIIGVASAIAVLAIPDPRGRLADEADRFAARTRAAHDSAIVSARPVSVWVAPSGYGFEAREAGRWAPIGDKAFKVTEWSKGTRANVAGARDRVVFDPTGLVDRTLDLRLTRDGASASVLIGADGGVRVGK